MAHLTNQNVVSKKPPAPEKVTVYSATSAMQHPATLLWSIALDVKAGNELAIQLFLRDLKGQFRQTYFGYAWAVATPLIASLTFIFLQSQGIVTVEGTGIPYAPFAMIGTLLWQSFADAINGPSVAVGKARAMLTKINFPREALIVGSIYGLLFNSLIRMAILIVVMVYWQITPNAGLASFIPAIATLILLGTGVGLILSPLSGLYGDVSRIITVACSFLMLLTPVLYPVRTEGLLGTLQTWNPITPVLITARESLIGQPLSSLASFCAVALTSGIILAFGLITYRLTMPHIIARMGG